MIEFAETAPLRYYSPLKQQIPQNSKNKFTEAPYTAEHFHCLMDARKFNECTSQPKENENNIDSNFSNSIICYGDALRCEANIKESLLMLVMECHHGDHITLQHDLYHAFHTHTPWGRIQSKE